MTLYTYNATTKSLTAAPRAVRIDGVTYANPTQETLRRAGIDAHPLAADTPPTPPEGKVAVADGYELTDGAWHRTYRYEDAPPPPPKEYDVYKLILALKALTVTIDGAEVSALAPAIEWVKANGLYEEFLTARTIRADDTDLMGAISTLAASLGVTPEQVAEILEEAEA